MKIQCNYSTMDLFHEIIPKNLASLTLIVVYNSQHTFLHDYTSVLGPSLTTIASIWMEIMPCWCPLQSTRKDTFWAHVTLGGGSTVLDDDWLLQKCALRSLPVAASPAMQDKMCYFYHSHLLLKVEIHNF